MRAGAGVSYHETMASEPEWTADKLRKLRRALVLTQTDIGVRLGVSPSRISSWETGRAERISWHYYEKLRSIQFELDTRLDQLEQLTREFMSRHVRKTENQSLALFDLTWNFLDFAYRNGLQPHHGKFATQNFQAILRRLGVEVPIDHPMTIVGLELYNVSSFEAHQLAVPEAAPGPDYAPVDGKLRFSAHTPTAKEADSQQRLHDRLVSKTKQLLATLSHAGNQYAELVRAVEEYLEVVTGPLDVLDVTGLWSVGGSLHSLMTAYKNQDALTLAPPLEPQMAAGLASLVRDHGAFILGFEEGRILIDRADQFLLEADIVSEMEYSAKELLHELATNADLVEEHTRKIHITVEDALQKADWGASRVTYTAYAIVRNAFRAIVRHSVGREFNLSTVGGAVGFLGLAAGDPSLEFMRVAIPVLLQHSSQLLSFCAHSPELRSYVEWALATLENDKARRS